MGPVSTHRTSLAFSQALSLQEKLIPLLARSSEGGGRTEVALLSLPARPGQPLGCVLRCF